MNDEWVRFQMWNYFVTKPNNTVRYIDYIYAVNDRAHTFPSKIYVYIT